MSKTISTTELAQLLGNSNLVVVDVRPLAAYNGWQLQGEARGGHIRGAVACPLSWLEKVEMADLGPLLAAKGISPDRTIVVYGYSPDDSAVMVRQLTELGYEEARTYQAGLLRWAADERLPMARLTHYEKLVHPEWVHRLINGQQPETYPGKGFVVFHVNFGVPEEYAAGHLPGAVYLDTNALESPSDWNRRSAPELEGALQAHGITHDKTVVLYGRDTVPDPDEQHPGRRAGQIAATRAAAILMYAGVEDVRLLDGGYDAWLSAGYTIETEERHPSPVPAFGAPVPGRPDYFIDLDEAKALLTDPNGALVSIRTWDEFIGNDSGYNYIGPKGRIAGAVWGNCGTDAYHMQHYRNIDNTMRDYHEIEANWLQADIRPDKRVAFYCGTGWRASETFFYAHLMGWSQVAVYDGGWFEWSRDPSNPIETGVPTTGTLGSQS
jgi:molybdopterin synthase sulfurtransferase